jgi:hypothetical protein
MTNYEMVELLRNKANVSYEEAKAALEAADWDLLDAIVLLEREGKVPEGDAGFSTKQEASGEHGREEKAQRGPSGFKQAMHGLGDLIRRALNYGNRNFVVASKGGEEKLSLPLTVFVILLFLPPFWLVVAIMVASLFFGVRYSLKGAHPTNDKVNEYIHRAESAADRVKHEFQGGAQDHDGDASNR